MWALRLRLVPLQGQLPIWEELWKVVVGWVWEGTSNADQEMEGQWIDLNLT